jgi:hypothetical protein
MNEVFSFRRFSRLFVKHTVEHYRIYLMSIGLLAGVLLLAGSFLFFVIPDPPDPGFQEASYIMLLFLAGGIFTSTVFSDFGEKNKAIPALTLPATTLEKYMVGWLYSYPIFLVIYTGVFYLTLLGLSSIKHRDASHHFNLFHLWRLDLSLVLLLFSVLHGFALFGAILFRKLQFIKTGFAFFIGLAFAVLVNTLFVQAITGVKLIKLAIPFGFLNFYVGDKYYSISIPGLQPLTVLGLLALVAVLSWVAAYFKLKEKQV